MTLEPRFVGIDMVANHCDAVVTHQWENGLNYLYYEVLYGGYPLIHNSPFLKEYGYYYEDFNAGSGGELLLTARREHEANLTQYKKDVGKLLASVDPNSNAVIKRHESLLSSIGKGKSA